MSTDATQPPACTVAVAFALTPQDLVALDAVGPAAGQRYPDMRSIDT